MKNKKVKMHLFNSAKMRVMIAAAVVIAMATVGVMVWQASIKRNALQSTVDVSGAPKIESVPGTGNPTMEYVKQQDIENAKNAEEARASGKSAVPTINRGSFVGSIGAFGELPIAATQCPIDPNSLPVADPNSCTVDSLQRARDSGVRAIELRCKGCTCPSLKSAGYTLGDLKETGLDAKALRDCGFSLEALKAAGFSAADLRTAGFSADALRAAGFTAAELRTAGFSAADLKTAGFSAADLANAGFSDTDLKAAGFTDKEIQNARMQALLPTSKACNPEELKKARDAGVSAQALKAKGCGSAALKAAGYTAMELRAAGFNAKELKDAGFSVADLKAAGFSAADLKKAGFSAGQLKEAGFSPEELRAAGFSAADLHAAGFSAEDLKNAGFSAAELAAADYTKGDLLRAGFTPTEAGYVSNASPSDEASIAQTVNPETAASAFMPKMKTNSPNDQLADLERQQQLRVSKQQRQDMIMQQQGAMSMQAQKLLVGWSNYTAQTRETAIPDVAPAVAQGAQGNTTSSSEGGDVVKAGDIMFAVLDTAVNTDEKGTPIMARIVGGPYKGGKIIGRFTLVDKRVLLSFNLLNLPDRGKSVAINAVAIDPDTARTAMSGEVDNHYLLRYGTFFASAFLSGISNAITSSGATTQTTVTGTVTTYPQLNPTESALVGLGQVGKEYSKVLGQNINMPPTVTIQAGTGMGLLFMNDVTVPPAQ